MVLSMYRGAGECRDAGAAAAKRGEVDDKAWWKAESIGFGRGFAVESLASFYTAAGKGIGPLSYSHSLPTRTLLLL